MTHSPLAPRKTLHVNLFEMACVSHIVHGMWREEGNNRQRFGEMAFWLDTARKAEQAGMDAIFLADVIGIYDRFGGLDASLRLGLQIPNLDPLSLIPAMAAVTTTLGFAATFSTTYEPPFAFARRMSTLDLLTEGRVGWNVVTSYLPNAARNFGLDGELEHDSRYDRADEYLEVLYKLWEGSWEDDAVIEDREGDRYADPERVRHIHHDGDHFRVEGPHLVQPTPQRTPVLFQATGSPRGLKTAARHAEAVFIGGRTQEEVRRAIARTREAAAAQGRDPAELKFYVMAGLIAGHTEEEAQAKLARYRALYSVEGALVHAQAEIDLRQFDPSLTLGEALAQSGRALGNMGRRFGAEQTIGAALAQIASFDEGRFFRAGTPEQIADDIETWLDEDGIDGINLRQYHSHETLDDYATLIAPELRRRGRLPPAPVQGETLRHRLTGRDRLPDTHPAALYRSAPASWPGPAGTGQNAPLPATDSASSGRQQTVQKESALP
ncbi:monooxygenase [Asaia krungthepensis NRIC 0535]|uniref:Monooxygenase n=2 Tax=Asaia krungthepensis TaxID=220990 RepID=A0ABQ0Q6T9_9PROT|nr:NtaA/DmoA family FMN-dependent monooxygenase [Asaia krungthepensis]GBQ93968.1 monooxygenase [Asaia krungthepensis NRIC 0535]